MKGYHDECLKSVRLFIEAYGVYTVSLWDIRSTNEYNNEEPHSAQ